MTTAMAVSFRGRSIKRPSVVAGLNEPCSVVVQNPGWGPPDAPGGSNPTMEGWDHATTGGFPRSACDVNRHVDTGCTRDPRRCTPKRPTHGHP